MSWIENDESKSGPTEHRQHLALAAQQLSQQQLVIDSAAEINRLRDAREIRKERDRHRKRNMTEEQKLRAREQALQRREQMSDDELYRRRERDRERKRLRSLDLEYKRELNLKSKERKASMDKETLEKVRERDRVRKRKEYKVNTADTSIYESQVPQELITRIQLSSSSSCSSSVDQAREDVSYIGHDMRMYRGGGDHSMGVNYSLQQYNV
jgi:hypothetical protein